MSSNGSNLEVNYTKRNKKKQKNKNKENKNKREKEPFLEVRLHTNKREPYMGFKFLEMDIDDVQLKNIVTS